METSDFLSQVLAGSGQYCVFAAKPNGPKKQKFYPSIERMLNAALEMDRDKHDVYFGLATFDGAGTRKAAHALSMRSLFVDLDCGPTKSYPDAPTAISALKVFCKKAGMPKPIIVSSGYGVHVYWPLSADTEVAKWKPVALALKRSCAAHGLHIDTDVTADAARVLRVPGTQNRKNGAEMPVSLLGLAAGDARTLGFYADLLDAEPVAQVNGSLFENVTMRASDDPVMKKLLSNRESSFKRILQKTMNGAGCAQIEYAVANQADIEEPLWRAVLSITKFCTDVEKASHFVSKDHPEYDPAVTAEKLVGIKGPYTCDTFDACRPNVCASCPLRGKITSPIQIGAIVKEAEVEVIENEADAGAPKVVYKGTDGDIPRYPFPYVRGKTGGVYVRQEDDDGNPGEVMVYTNDLYYTKRVVDYDAGECIIGKLHLPNDGVREFAVSLVAATSKEELRKILAKHGVAVGGKRWDYVMAYTQAWIEHLQTTTVADTAKTQFGWTDNSFTSYVIGDREIFADRVGYNPPSTKTSFLFPALKPQGTLEGWVNQAKFYDREGMEPYQFVVCQALAAPLVRLTAVNAAIFDFYSDGTGHGKSTTQKFALTIYGEPGDLIVGHKDTLNSRMNRMELMKDVNVQMDEFTEFPAEQTPEMIYSITEGRQKARMVSSGNEERYRGKAWCTTVTASSNQSMLAKVYAVKGDPRAEVQRVLSYHVQAHTFADKSETDMFAKAVGDHYGHAVEVFVQKIMQDVGTVKALLESVQAKLDVACGLDMTNRFWSAQGAVAITALILAREVGLLSYDPAVMFEWVKKLIMDNKADDEGAAVSVDAVVNEFVSENYGNILWIKSTDDFRSDINHNGLDSLVTPEKQPHTRLVARYETDTKKLFIMVGPFKDWCTKRRLNYASVAAAVCKEYKGVKLKIRMCKGTKMQLPTAWVLALNCAELGLKERSNGGSET